MVDVERTVDISVPFLTDRSALCFIGKKVSCTMTEDFAQKASVAGSSICKGCRSPRGGVWNRESLICLLES